MITSAAAFVVVAAASIAAAPPPESTSSSSRSSEAPVEVWRASSSSPRVVLAPNANAPDAALRVVFLAGAADDGLEEGLTRLSQYAMLHGQARAPYAALDAAVYGADGALTVETSVRACSFTFVAPNARGAGAFDDVAAKLLSQVLAPKIDAAGLERARRLATTDILEAGSQQWLEAFVAADVLVTEGVEGGGDYNNPIWGDAEVLRRISLANVHKHIATKLAPANAIVVATGRFDAARLKREIAQLTGGKERAFHRPDILKALPLSRVHDAPREVHYQLQVVDVTDAKSAALVHVLTAALRDRLFFKLRKSGHVYSPFVTARFQEWLDFILIGFEVTEHADVDLSKTMLDEMDALAGGQFTNDELARAKAMAKHDLLALEDDAGAYAMALEARVRNEITVGPDVRAAVDDVDKAALTDAASRFLTGKRAVSWTFGQSASSAAKRGAP